MFMRRLLLAAALMLLPTAAFADEFTVYQAQGLFDDGYALGGTATLDTTTMVFTASSLAMTRSGNNSYTFNSGASTRLNYNPSLPGAYYFIFQTSPASGPGAAELFVSLVALPSPGKTLDFCSITEPCGPVLVPPAGNYESYATYALSFSGMFGQYPFAYDLSSGQLTPLATAATPEPSSLLLLGTGLVATCAAVRRRLFC